MNEIASFEGIDLVVTVEERDCDYVVLIRRADGTLTRVGAPYRSRFRAIQAAQRLADAPSPHGQGRRD